MPRSCSICESKTRNEIDRCLLEMPITHTTIRGISRKFQVSEDALGRHRDNHLSVDLADVHDRMIQAREVALAEVKAGELENTKTAIVEGESARIKAGASLLDQLRDLRVEGWQILQDAKEDPRLALGAIQRLAQLLVLQAEIEGKIRASQIQVAISHAPNEFANCSEAELDRIIQKQYSLLGYSEEDAELESKKTTLSEAVAAIKRMEEEEKPVSC